MATDEAGKDLRVEASVIDVKQLLDDVMSVLNVLLPLEEQGMTRIRLNNALVGAIAVTSIEAGIDEETTMNYVRDLFRAVKQAAD